MECPHCTIDQNKYGGEISCSICNTIFCIICNKPLSKDDYYHKKCVRIKSKL
jgi:transcription elongation factor Elf1